jgi:CheY-like chemotaxis protein
MEAHVSRSLEGTHKRILIVDTNPAVRNSLAEQLRASGFEVVTAATGEQAFYLLRDWHHPIGWLYTRADLPGLIDGWILADEYHDSHPDRAAVIATSRERVSAQGHVVLSEPSLAAALDALQTVASANAAVPRPAAANPDLQRLAA